MTGAKFVPYVIANNCFVIFGIPYMYLGLTAKSFKDISDPSGITIEMIVSNLLTVVGIFVFLTFICCFARKYIRRIIKEENDKIEKEEKKHLEEKRATNVARDEISMTRSF